MNPLLLELIRQALRLIGVLLMNVPWIPASFVALTGNEEVVLWFAGVAAYAVADTGWLVVKWHQFAAWWGRR